MTPPHTSTSLLFTLQQYKAQRRKTWAILIDTDKTNALGCLQLINYIEKSAAKPDFFLVGSSLLVSYDQLHEIVLLLKNHTKIPVLLFPGSYLHLSSAADAVLFLSLISGRNPDFLIGNQVLAAPLLKKSKLEVIPTGYLLIDGGKPTSVAYISNTQPIPADKIDIAVCTALAGQYLGLQVLYLEAGSGATFPVSPALIHAVQQTVTVPLIVGGGIKTAEQFAAAFMAGADLVITGNIVEKQPQIVQQFAEVLNKLYK